VLYAQPWCSCIQLHCCVGHGHVSGWAKSLELQLHAHADMLSQVCYLEHGLLGMGIALFCMLALQPFACVASSRQPAAAAVTAAA
jgi:hypothetical protein